MTDLSSTTISRHLNTKLMGRTHYVYAQLDSTNTRLKQLADQGAPEGTLVIADEQLAGKGRFARVWHAPPGSSLLMSLLFRPDFLPPDQVQQLTMLCALAMVDAVNQLTGVDVGLKWPNDLVYQSRKLAGILTEASYLGGTLGWVVVGLGLNVTFDFSTLSGLEDAEQQSLTQKGISLQMITGRAVSRLALLQTYLAGVEARYNALRAGESPVAAWSRRLVTLGQQIVFVRGGVRYTGLAESVDETGILQVRLPDEQLMRITAGEVSLQAEE